MNRIFMLLLQTLCYVRHFLSFMSVAYAKSDTETVYSSEELKLLCQKMNVGYVIPC
jgi:hypothetical protein